MQRVGVVVLLGGVRGAASPAHGSSGVRGIPSVTEQTSSAASTR
jgi:hypothetical protein